jgi:hypothetical protein
MLRQILCIAFLVCSSWQAGSAFAGQRNSLSPAKVKQIQKSNKGFKQCLASAIKMPDPGRAKIALKQCRDRFPGAGLAAECKKAAFKRHKGATSALKAAISDCKRFQLAASFDERNPVPFLLYQDQLYFAGLGLNAMASRDDLDPPNFNCSRLDASMKGEEEWQHVLFGNHPKAFVTHDRLSSIKQLLEVKVGQSIKTVAGLGQIYGDVNKDSSNLFFASAPCDFAGQTGKLFDGLSVYYLQPDRGRIVTPSFGVAYFRKGQDGATTEDVKSKILNTLGSEYAAQEKDETTTFFAVEKLAEFDDEGDPRNICMAPRKHRVIAVLKTFEGQKARPQFLIVANTRNLCDYGDRLLSARAKR